MMLTFQTLIVERLNEVCTVTLNRPDSNNCINNVLIAELNSVLDECYESVRIVVLQGSEEYFCFGADFKEIQHGVEHDKSCVVNPEPLYDLWVKLCCGPFISIAHVRGKVNAGGIGFVASCDIVISDEKAVFSLSEMLFDLVPACVMPFLVRRIGISKSNRMTLMTLPIDSATALNWGLVDAVGSNSIELLRRHMLRLRRLSKQGITSYKSYVNGMDPTVSDLKQKAIDKNIEVFTNPRNIQNITRYVANGQFPWDANKV